MGKKNKKEKKGKGKEKTDLKTEKKAEKRSKKDLADKGEEDIEKLIAEFQEQDRRMIEVIEEKCPPPSPRCNMSLVAHPERDELLMFGGEYFTGKKMFLNNDLFVYQIKRNEWMKVSIPNPPPPRSAHQAVVVYQGGGQMWVFGGEFSSHTQSQFYHYKDLWVLQLKEKKWTQVKSPGGPSARSGHRMGVLKKQIFVFGGFNDNGRDYKYFDDLFMFDIETYTWSKLCPSGNGPSPRSGCVVLSVPESERLIFYGGYSKEKVKRDVDKGTTHTDMWALLPEKKKESESESTKWKWQPMKQSGIRPSPRSGMSGLVVPGSKAFCFGGVFDEEDDDEQLEGVFYNELWTLDINKGKWFPGQFRGRRNLEGDKKKRRRKAKNPDANENLNEAEDDDGDDGSDDNKEDEDMELTQDAIENLEIDKSQSKTSSDSVFTVTVAESSSNVELAGASSNAGMEVDQFWPSARMNAALAVRDGVFYLYGGIHEDGDRQSTLADFYSVDVHKMDEWRVLVGEDKTVQEWHGSDSSDNDDDQENGAKGPRKTQMEDDESDDEDSDESMEITFDDAPGRKDGEDIVDYYTRTQQYWMGKAKEIYEEEGESISDRQLSRFAKELCEEACEK